VVGDERGMVTFAGVGDVVDDIVAQDLLTAAKE